MKQRSKTLHIATFLLLALLIHSTTAAATFPGATTGAQQGQIDPQATPVPQAAVDGAKPPLLRGAPIDDPVITADDSANQRLNDATGQSAAPTINVWYGTQQNFGQLGDPQKWINILGNVSGPQPINLLTYSLNGQPPEPLSIGPDGKRLAEAGDFNIELDYTDLQSGSNQVVITAVDGGGQQTSRTVTVNYQKRNSGWPSTYVVNWNQASNLLALAQPVDGQWRLDGNTVRPITFDYDRLLAIGDMSWSDYEITVPVIVHGIDESGYGGASNGPGIGIITRWTGHYLRDNEQPRTGWENIGALGWYRWANPSLAGLQLVTYGGKRLVEPGDIGKQLAFNTQYIFKMRVDSVSGGTARYRFKMWPASETEPAAWDMDGRGATGEPLSGSLVLVAHHVDAQFGKVTVTINDTVPAPQLSVAVSGRGSVERNPDKASYRFAEDVMLTAVPDEGYVFGGWAGDLAGTQNPGALTLFEDAAVTAVFVDPNQVLPASDSFNGCGLNEELWTFIDPLNDAEFELTNGQVNLIVPGGKEHNVWSGGNNAPRIMQPARDVDFELEAHFDSPVTQRSQIQGFIIEQDKDNFLRFDVYRSSSDTRLYAARFVNGAPEEMGNMVINDISNDFYMRIERVGDQWTQRYSYNGNSWTDGAQFEHALTVTSAGLFAGNAGTNPAFTAVIDYFLNEADPIDLDAPGPNALTVQKVGNGSVTRSPDKTDYNCNEVVTITAVPDTGWNFASWSGAATGKNNPTTVTMDGNATVTATFTPEEYVLNLSTSGGGNVNVNPVADTYTYDQNVTLTAVPQPGWEFTRWSGDVPAGDVNKNPLTLTIKGDTAVVASFTKVPYSITVNVVNKGQGDGGFVSIVPEQVFYYYGDDVTLRAVPAENWQFIGWGGDLSGSNPQTTLTVTGDHVVTATFAYKEQFLFLPVILFGR